MIAGSRKSQVQPLWTIVEGTTIRSGQLSGVDPRCWCGSRREGGVRPENWKPAVWGAKLDSRDRKELVWCGRCGCPTPLQHGLLGTPRLCCAAYKPCKPRHGFRLDLPRPATEGATTRTHNSPSRGQTLSCWFVFLFHLRVASNSCVSENPSREKTTSHTRDRTPSPTSLTQYSRAARELCECCKRSCCSVEEV